MYVYMIFCQTLDDFEKQLTIYCLETGISDSVTEAVKSCCCLCWHTLPVFIDIDLSPRCAMLAFSPRLSKELVPACMDVVHGECIRSFCELIGEPQ